MELDVFFFLTEEWKEDQLHYLLKSNSKRATSEVPKGVI